MSGILSNNDCVCTNDRADGFQLIYGVIKEQKTQSLRMATIIIDLTLVCDSFAFLELCGLS